MYARPVSRDSEPLPYSEEEGTFGAENFKDDVPQEVKQDRLDALMSLQREISLDFNSSRVGSVERVLVDSIVDGTLVCRSEFESPDVDGEILVKDPSGKLKPGDFADVKITAADEYDLVGELIV